MDTNMNFDTEAIEARLAELEDRGATVVLNGTALALALALLGAVTIICLTILRLHGIVLR